VGGSCAFGFRMVGADAVFDGDMFARAVAIVSTNIQSREEESLCQATLVMMCILIL
jgi:hypothetical protein